MNILDDLQNIFIDVFDDEDIVLTEETSSKDIDDWDSLAQINLVIAIEQQYKVKFNLEEISKLANVGEMIELIVNKVS